MNFKLLVFVGFLVCNDSLLAADWSSTYITYLNGTGFVMPGDDSGDISYDTITIENASGLKYGDTFFFFDITDTDSDNVGIYGEIAPRLSSSKIFDYKWNGFVTDILLASQLNFATGTRRVELYGIGLDFKIPGFDFFQANFYRRDNKSVKGVSEQLTLAWQSSFELGVPLVFAGFLDYASKEGDEVEANLLTQPQLMWMVMKNLGVGIEYLYWQNKFGVEDLDESVTQLLVKWTL